MVLESLVTPIVAEDKRGRVLWLGFLFSIVGAFVTSLIAGPNTGIDGSLILVFFTAMPAIPLIYGIIKYEEKQDIILKTETALLKQHSKALASFMYLFIGMILGMVLVFMVSSTEFRTEAFSSQIETLKSIGVGLPTGQVTEYSKGEMFNHIFFNNLKVLMLAIVFSFLFGAGAIFILTWNASVIATAIGVFINNQLAELGYVHSISVGLFMFSIHGIPEIAAYYTAALAGGIISVAVIRHHYTTEKFERIVLDSADLLLISIGLLFIAALLEVFVTPFIVPLLY